MGTVRRNRTAHYLAVVIHFIVILLIVARGDIVEPLLVVKIPADGLFNALFELEARLPTQFTLQFARVYSIAQVVAGTVGDEGDEIHVLTLFATQQSVYGFNNHLDDIDVLTFLAASRMLRISNLAFV